MQRNWVVKELVCSVIKQVLKTHREPGTICFSGESSWRIASFAEGRFSGFCFCQKHLKRGILFKIMKTIYGFFVIHVTKRKVINIKIWLFIKSIFFYFQMSLCLTILCLLHQSLKTTWPWYLGQYQATFVSPTTESRWPGLRRLFLSTGPIVQARPQWQFTWTVELITINCSCILMRITFVGHHRDTFNQALSTYSIRQVGKVMLIQKSLSKPCLKRWGNLSPKMSKSFAFVVEFFTYVVFNFLSFVTFLSKS